MGKRLIGSVGLASSGVPDDLLTTKGDQHGFSSTNARIPVGTNNQSVLADSGEALGLKWGASSTSTLTTTGDLLVASGANTLSRIAGGTSGDVLTAGGVGVVPTYQTPSSGAWTQEGSQTESGFVATLSVDVSDKDFYQVFYNISSESTTSCSASVRINSVSSGYEWLTLSQYATTTSSHENTSDSQVVLEPSQSAKTSYGVITIYKSDTNARETGTLFRGIAGNAKSGIGINYMSTNAGYVSTTGAISSIQILYNAGNVLGSMTVMSADF